MPYIVKADRGKKPLNAGQLNYHLTMVMLWYLKQKGESYQTYNDILGVLTAMQFEIYRRKIAPYEDKKCRENGEVF